MTDRKDYEVGYGRPPKHSRFKPGQSGNPRGRPKGAKNVATVLRETMGKKITITENGRRKTISWLDAIVLRLSRSAVEGDARAIDRVIKLLPMIETALAGEATESGSGAPSASHFAGKEDLEMLKLFGDAFASGEWGFDDTEDAA